MTEIERYPENEMEIAQPIPAEWSEFADLMENLLLNYRFNTARAYRNDLVEWFYWAIERGKSVLNLSEADQKQYCALLRRRNYSENTIRRRQGTLRLLYKLRDAGGEA